MFLYRLLCFAVVQLVDLNQTPFCLLAIKGFGGGEKHREHFNNSLPRSKEESLPLCFQRNCKCVTLTLLTFSHLTPLSQGKSVNNGWKQNVPTCVVNFITTCYLLVYIAVTVPMLVILQL